MHQHFIKGKKLLLIYKDGTQEVAKYEFQTKESFISLTTSPSR